MLQMVFNPIDKNTSGVTKRFMLLLKIIIKLGQKTKLVLMYLFMKMLVSIHICTKKDL